MNIPAPQGITDGTFRHHLSEVNPWDNFRIINENRKYPDGHRGANMAGTSDVYVATPATLMPSLSYVLLYRHHKTLRTTEMDFSLAKITSACAEVMVKVMVKSKERAWQVVRHAPVVLLPATHGL